MRIVLDSNVLLVSIGIRSRFRPIWQAFITGKYELAVSEDILHEYEEILQEHSANGVAELVMDIFAESPDIVYQHVYYNWDAIKKDRDDNKFFDVAIAASVDFLVTNDAHFKEAAKLKFPKVNIVSADAFLEILE
ncbi:MAG: putative toxin-antitoxin system toxin component, PIN family [Pseudopedobacter saltans]|uniref:Putative toxin-antitoxin system toxin component, PIN family n=1 Tax=Pseudopedobacter saltans TaxID=151895 RepID=A0A2W5GVG4_9SPHI|nr:MAG: putative toxin-antitoxin system toxin component, PIN family [Pseudopedobacter saltans]